MSNFSSNRRFRMEHLEDRRLMGGDPQAVVSQGTLFINEAPGHEGGAQNVAVSQLEGGKIRLTGLTSPVNVAGSLINNGLDRVEFKGVNNIVVNLGGGQ
ncbi:MAG TPA: hypothetical protein VEQ85_05380, partial [Lacipirellulaceae bacterium]|nr:hypothetical protein [Lacipirellulaceae bacterium]